MATNIQAHGDGPVLQFDVPLPTDDQGLRVRVARHELDRLISGRMSVLAGTDPEKQQALATLSIQKAELEFFPDRVRVRVSIPVPRQRNLFGKRKRRMSLSGQLFESRDDEPAQETVQSFLTIVDAAANEVRQLSTLIHEENLDPKSLVGHASFRSNKALREFVVRGGEARIDVDGHQVSIEAQSGPHVIEAPQPVAVSVKLDPPSGYTSALVGIVTSAGVGAAAMIGPGRRLRLGLMKSRPIEKGLLLIASALQVEVQLEVQLAVSTIRLSALTAEVLKVNNGQEISARLSASLNL